MVCSTHYFPASSYYISKHDSEKNIVELSKVTLISSWIRSSLRITTPTCDKSTPPNIFSPAHCFAVWIIDFLDGVKSVEIGVWIDGVVFPENVTCQNHHKIPRLLGCSLR